VRLETGFTPPRLQLRVGPRRVAVPTAPLRAAEEVVAERAPGQQSLDRAAAPPRAASE
jgi:hypothetical protein